jgi:hypothetical protein
MNGKRAAIIVVAGYLVAYIATLIELPVTVGYYLDIICRILVVVIAALLCAGSCRKRGGLIVGLIVTITTLSYGLILRYMGTFSELNIYIVDFNMRLSESLGYDRVIPFIGSLVVFLGGIGLLLLFQAFLQQYEGTTRTVALGGIALFALSVVLTLAVALGIVSFSGMVPRTLSFVAVLLMYLPKLVESSGSDPEATVDQGKS